MRIAGFGFRRAATSESLRGALAAAGGALAVDGLATAAGKADAACLRELAAQLRVPVHAIAADALAAIATPTRSARVAALYGTGSLAEAAALAAAGPGARLVAPRAVSPDGLATAAIAERVRP